MAALIKCPNPDCGALDFRIAADVVVVEKGPPLGVNVAGLIGPAGIGNFQFLPAGGAPLSSYVPASVQQDYAEAHLIRILSPKASATLSRRALQGMIRDFWSISKGSLADEIKAIEPQCDPGLFQAMNALRSIGNIGAHPERDISTIVDIDPEEADQLLELLRLLDQEWYVVRADRASRVQQVLALGVAKSAARAAGTSAAATQTAGLPPASKP